MSALLTPLAADVQAHFDWMRERPARRILGALIAVDRDCVRFVGGCVRDSLLGVTPKDIDVATTLTPDRVMNALTAAGLGAAPTGLDHGTVTAIADHVPIEVTTLRADVSTDGRRASVAYTTDWLVDARRRDFTINALYLTPDGLLYDPVGGADDLAARRVRFIGAAEDRIREDYLRILRYFRFSARFADNFDEDGLAACRAMTAGIGRLSAERVGDEFTKILALAAAPRAVDAMIANGVLAEIWPARPAGAVLARLKTIAPDAPAALGLAALWGAGGAGVDIRLRLSNAAARRRANAVLQAGTVTPQLSDQAIRALIYRLGTDGFCDALLIAQSQSTLDLGAVRNSYARHHALAITFAPPLFPVSGRDVLAGGVPAGPAVAAALAAAETRWVAEDFPNAARARAILSEEIARLTSTG